MDSKGRTIISNESAVEEADATTATINRDVPMNACDFLMAGGALSIQGRRYRQVVHDGGWIATYCVYTDYYDANGDYLYTTNDGCFEVEYQD
jgi:hypothetical protein